MTHELSIDRRIDAPPERVWDVMTGRITEWWRPKPWTTTIGELEWRAGGAFHLIMRGPNDEPDCQGEESAGGVLLEFEPGRRFVFTDALSARWVPQTPFMVGIFEIEAEGDGTRYRATARHWTAEAVEEHRKMGFEQGWGAVADQLAKLAEGVPA
ncbi:MAG: SRPBCC domain-containing protein [Sphingomonas sp.]|nr:SRPBCC domain-containing protein [Sphingomonas sp.]